MARFLRPPIIQGGAHHLAGYSLALVRRLRPIHILAWAILAAFLFAVTECLRDGRFKTKLPVFDALDLVDFKDGRPTVPLDLHPQQAVRIAKANRFDDRYEFQHLIGHGCEGDVAIYRDLHTDSPVAVKSYYNNGRHPMGETWSQLFSHQLNTWPTEIPATLLLAGLHPHHSTTNLTHQGPHTFQHGLIPASDFFIALSPNPTSPLLPSWTTPSWHLVTPYLPHGTLASLAITLAQQSGNHTLAALDASFRPSFARLLSALATLHAKGFCHDDVKADNIYIAPTHHSWLLGDLGQVRAVGHAYHRTRHWARRNQWADCRANDVRRALKTYLGFLRAAAPQQGFDGMFFAGVEPLSALYWDFVRAPVGAEEVVGWLREGAVYRVREGEEAGEGRVDDALLGFAVERELTCTRVDGWGWRWREVRLRAEALWLWVSGEGTGR